MHTFVHNAVCLTLASISSVIIELEVITVAFLAVFVIKYCTAEYMLNADICF